MKNLKTKRKMMPMYSAKDYFAGKKDAKPVGQMNNPDAIGPMIVDRETLFRLMAASRPASFRPPETEVGKNSEATHA